MQRPQRKRHPHRHLELQVAVVLVPVRMQHEHGRGHDRGVAPAGQRAHEQIHRDARQHERREKEHVVDDDLVNAGP